jgi:hypothetical protein
MTLLLRYWKPIAAAVALLTVAVAIKLWAGLLYERGYEAARVEVQNELDRYRAHQREVNEETERVHEQSIAALRADVARELRGRPIRMCVSSDEVRAGSNPATSAGSAGGEPALRASADLRPAIVHLGETCEQLRQQLIAIRERQAALRSAAQKGD